MSLQHPTAVQSGSEGVLGETLGQRVALFAAHFIFCVGLLQFHAEFTQYIYTSLVDVLVIRSFEEVALGIVLSLVPLFWIPLQLRLPSQIFAYILYLGAYIPFNTVGLQSVAIGMGALLPYMLLCCFSIIGLFVVSTFPPVALQREGLPINRLAIGVAIGSVISVALMSVTLGFSLEPIAIADVYDFRADRRLQFAEGGVAVGLIRYLIDPTTLVAASFLVVAGVLARRPIVLMAGALAMFAGYQTSGQKDGVGAAAIALIALFIWGGRSRQGHFGFSTLRIAVMFTVLMAVASFYDNWTGDPSRLFSQLTIGRLFIATGMISSYWVEFFADHPLNLFTGTGFIGLIAGRENEYGMPIARVIGLVYGGNEENNANSNLWADGYGNLGYMGVILATVVAMVLFRLLDRLSVRRDMRFLLPVCLPLAFSLTNGPIVGLVSTNGLWLVFLIAYFLPLVSSGLQDFNKSGQA